MTEEPTIEELQAQLTELKMRFDDERTARTKAEESLQEARKLNGRYLTQVLGTKGGSQPPDDEPHKETMEEFCDSFINAHKEEQMKIFGSIIGGK